MYPELASVSPAIQRFNDPNWNNRNGCMVIWFGDVDMYHLAVCMRPNTKPTTISHMSSEDKI